MLLFYLLISQTYSKQNFLIFQKQLSIRQFSQGPTTGPRNVGYRDYTRVLGTSREGEVEPGEPPCQREENRVHRRGGGPESIDPRAVLEGRGCETTWNLCRGSHTSSLESYVPSAVATHRVLLLTHESKTWMLLYTHPLF